MHNKLVHRDGRRQTKRGERSLRARLANFINKRGQRGNLAGGVLVGAKSSQAEGLADRLRGRRAGLTEGELAEVT